MAAGAQVEEDHLRLGHAIVAERARLPPEAIRGVHVRVVLRARLLRNRREPLPDERVDRRLVEGVEEGGVFEAVLGELWEQQQQRPVDAQLGVRAVGERDVREPTDGHAAQGVGGGGEASCGHDCALRWDRDGDSAAEAASDVPAAALSSDCCAGLGVGACAFAADASVAPPPTLVAAGVVGVGVFWTFVGAFCATNA